MNNESNFEKIEYLTNLPISNTDEKYLNQLQQYIESGECKTIGLIGDYGSGKSSIIKGLKERSEHNIIELSVSSFNFNNETTNSYTEQFSDDNNCSTNPTSTIDELRKNITLQILQQIDSDTSIFAQKLKGKLLKHYKYIHNKFDKIFSVFLLLLIFLKIILDYNVLNTFSDILEYSPSEFMSNFLMFINLLIDPILIISLIIFILFVVLKRFIFEYSEFKFDKFYFKKSENDSYLDYNLETILALIKYISTKQNYYGFKKNKSTVNHTINKQIYVFEDLDRYCDITILQELNHISKYCPSNTIFIFAISARIFNSPEETTKYFDALVDILPITNNEVLYDNIQKKFMDTKITTELITLLTPEIDNLRVFNSIYNKFNLLMLNYKELVNNPSQNDSDVMMVIAYLQTTHPTYVNNKANTRNHFKEFLDDVFNYSRYLQIINEDANNKIKSLQEQIEDLNSQIEDVKVIENIDYENYLNSIRLELYQKHANKGYRSTYDNKYYYINNFLKDRTIPDEVLIDFANQLLEKDKIPNYPIKQDVSKVYDEINGLRNKKNKLISKIEENSNYLSALDYITIINEYPCIRKYIKEECLKFAELILCVDSTKIDRFGGLLYSLIINKYITNDCLKYIIYNNSNITETEIMQRNFLYNYKSRVIVSPHTKQKLDYLNNKFLGKFPVSEFDNANFLNLKVLIELALNIRVGRNNERLIEVISNYKIGFKPLIEDYHNFKLHIKSENNSYINDYLNDYSKLFLHLFVHYFKYIINKNKFKVEYYLNKVDKLKIRYDNYQIYQDEIYELVIEYSNDFFDNKKNNSTNDDIYYMIIATINHNFLEKLNISEVNIIYQSLLNLGNIMIEALYIYYVNNYKNEHLLEKELFYVLEYNLDNTEINKTCREKFTYIFKDTYKIKKVQIKHKINDLVKFKENTFKLEGYVKPHKVYYDNIFVYNKINVDYMLSNEDDTFHNIKSSIKLIEFLVKSHDKINIGTSQFNYFLKKDLADKSLKDERVELTKELILKYKYNVVDLGDPLVDYQDFLMVHKLFVSNENNFNILLNHQKYLILVEKYCFDESYITKKDITEIFDTIDDNTQIDLSKIENIISRDLIEDKDKNIDLLLNNLSNSENEFNLLFDYIKNERIEKDTNLFKGLEKLLKCNNFDLQSLESLIENNINIIDLSHIYSIESNVLIIKYKEYSSEILGKFIDEVKQEDANDFRTKLLTFSPMDFLKAYYPTFKEYSQSSSLKSILSEYNLTDQIEYILRMDGSKNNMVTLLKDFNLYNKFEFNTSGRNSVSRKLSNRDTFTDEFLNLLIKDGIISDYDKERIYK